MKDFSDWIFLTIYGLFGAGIGLVIFLFGLGGWRYAFAGRATAAWNGGLALFLCVCVGAAWGALGYLQRDREFGSGGSTLGLDPAEARLFWRRIVVVATCFVGLYFVWQLARSMR